MSETTADLEWAPVTSRVRRARTAPEGQASPRRDPDQPVQPARRSSIMKIAWGFHREAIGKGESRLFSASLKRAWAWDRRMATYLQTHPLGSSRRPTSPIRRAGSSSWGRRGGRYLTSVLGR